MVRGKPVLAVLIESVGVVVALAIFGILFLAFNGGPTLIRTQVSVHRVRAALDPVARELGAKVEFRWNGMARCTVFYSLAEHYVAVPVGPGGGFNPWSRKLDERLDVNPPSEVNVLLSAAHRVCKTPGR